MEQLPRNAAMDGVDLYRRLDSGRGSKPINDSTRIGAVVEQIRQSLEADLASATTVRGWRAQAMFASLVVALDGCDLMTFVDTGDIFFDGDSVKAPDYFLHLRTGRRVLVDVKAPDVGAGLDLDFAIKFSASEIRRTARFADLFGAEPFFAFYYPGLPLWSLVPQSRIYEGPGGGFRITMRETLLWNELSLVGDVTLGTLSPIECVIKPDPKAPNEIVEGEAIFTVGEVQYVADGRQLSSDQSKRIAHFLMLYGGWPDEESSIVRDGQLVEMRYTSRGPEDSQQGFEIIGSLASMYARMFESSTSGPAGIISLDFAHDPGILASLIPHDYESKELPIWRFELRPGDLLPAESAPDFARDDPI